MKSWKKAGLALGLAVSIFAMAIGCSQQQINVVSQQAGIVAVATWMSVDNPTDVQKLAASGVVGLIKEKSSMVSSNSSYYATLMPIVSDYISTNVPVKDRLLCQLAGGWVLTGIDTLLAVNPGWQAKQTLAIGAVNSFCDGAMMGLAMTRDNPVIQASMKSAAVRTRLIEVEASRAK